MSDTIPEFRNLHTTAFALSMLSNLEAGKTDPSPAVLIANLTTAINTRLTDAKFQYYFGNWTIALGPYIYQNSPTDDKIDNAVVVFYNEAERIYVVAVSATNFISLYDWWNEDFAVSSTKDWPNSDAPSGTTISLGTYTGVNNILGMPYASVGQSGVSLQDYLASIASRDAKLIFTGHSLGGALSPTLALWLYGNANNQQTWGNIYVFPTAGATPGNQQFSDFFSQQFPPINDGSEVYDIWNQVLRNTLDIVPHAWLVSDLNELPSLYATATLEVRLELDALIVSILSIIPHTYTDLAPQYFSGTAPTATISTIKEYLDQASEQHVDAYFELFGVPENLFGDALKPISLSVSATMKDNFIRMYLTAINRLQANRVEP